MKAFRVTDPEFLYSLSERVRDFVLVEAPMPGVTYEGLFSYLYNSVGTDRLSEFWVVREGEVPVACAHWLLLTGTIYVKVTVCDFIYKWVKNREPVAILIQKWKEFGKQYGANYFEIGTTNHKVALRYLQMFKENQLEAHLQTAYNVVAVKEGH